MFGVSILLDRLLSTADEFNLPGFRLRVVPLLGRLPSQTKELYLPWFFVRGVLPVVAAPLGRPALQQQLFYP